MNASTSIIKCVGFHANSDMNVFETSSTNINQWTTLRRLANPGVCAKFPIHSPFQGHRRGMDYVWEKVQIMYILLSIYKNKNPFAFDNVHLVQILKTSY